MHSINAILQTIKLSIKNIKSNKMRTFLTTLGIIIGVGSIIAMVTISKSTTDEFKRQVMEDGLGMIEVTINGSVLKSSLSLEEVWEIEQIDNVEGVIPNINSQGTCAWGNTLKDKISIQGKSDFYYTSKPKELVKGRPLTRADIENATYVCVVDQKFQKDVFGGRNPVGQTVILNGKRYLVVGVEKGQPEYEDFPREDHGAATIPYTTALKMSGNSGIQFLMVSPKDYSYTEAVAKEIRTKLLKIFKRSENFKVDTSTNALKEFEKQAADLNMMTAGIASISLLVGGIGIMNMMLVSVTERTKEIGLRKSLGATPIRIQLQFLLESIVLSTMGGITGAIVGNLIAFAFAKLMLNIRFYISWPTVLMAFGFSTGIGILFGWAPAKKASQLNPIDALRSE